VEFEDSKEKNQDLDTGYEHIESLRTRWNRVSQPFKEP
jgi:hypothetical protein